MSRAERAQKVNRGDFQTPAKLARAVCQRVAAGGAEFATLVEPTCGEGALLVAGAHAFRGLRRVEGMEINPAYAASAAEALAATHASTGTVECVDFFSVDWQARLSALAEPLLVLGNPPWVTSAGVRRVGGDNLPVKTNTAGLKGLEALTGKSNFDISEWMMSCLLRALEGRTATLAMLCKTAVARKVLQAGWRDELSLTRAHVYGIDARRWFGAAVDAALLVVELGAVAGEHVAQVWPSLDASTPTSSFGYRDGVMVADVQAYARTRRWAGGCRFRWRSGVKHDCSRVMELRAKNAGFVNGLGEDVAIEHTRVFPMRKGSELAAETTPPIGRRMLVTQSRVGEDTAELALQTPRTWSYLQRHGDMLDARASSIYRKRPRFSVFGVGDYTFSLWKVAIAGLYKKLAFRVVGPHEGRPVVFDDTCYFVPCHDEAQACALAMVLMSPQAADFFSAYVFWDAKRPVTSGLLARLDVHALAAELGVELDEPTGRSEVAAPTGAECSTP